MRLAIMQPYFFPYLGYFQMLGAVDQFVFYDDVNFIKGGWIHRNRILIANEPSYISIPLISASSFKKINDIDTNFNEQAKSKFIKSISLNYGKAPYYNDVIPIVESVISKSGQNLAQVAANSISSVANYLNLETNFHFSSELDFGNTSRDRAYRLVEIANGFKAKTYINAQGGKELYSKIFFQSNGIDLKFIKSHLAVYRQNSTSFIPGLSIIDVLMHNSKSEVLAMLNQFELE